MALGTSSPESCALTLPGMEVTCKPRKQALRTLRIPMSGGAPSLAEFRNEFKRIVDEETVPESIPWAAPYD